MPVVQLWLLALAHFGIDLLTHILPPVMPALVQELGLTVTMAASLSTAMSVSSGLLQPVFGSAIDRAPRAWLLPVAVLWCGAFVALLGMASEYWALVLAAVLAGLGAALFHPLATVSLRHIVGRYSAGAMSIFSVGGTAGMAAAPMAFAAVSFMGISGLRWLLLPAVVIAAVLLAGGLHRVSLSSTGRRAGAGGGSREGSGGRSETEAPAGPDAMRPLVILTVSKLVRTVGQVAMVNFLALFYVFQGYSENHARLMLTVYLVAGSLSAIATGYISDRIGRKPVVIISSVLATPAWLAFLFTTGPLQTGCLIAASVFLYATFSVMPIYAQELVPRRPGMGAGLMMGGVWALAALCLVPLGTLADAAGVRAAMVVAAWLPLVSAGMALPVPETRPRASRLTFSSRLL
ncbi:MAG: MFS transporter [Firmicutes bacterium]|nr:MFS transporter [Bacillota bacterium]